MSYFRPQKAGKIGPRTVHSFSDSTSRLSQNAGRVSLAKCASSNGLTLGGHSTGLKTVMWIRSKVGKCFRINKAVTVGA